VKGGDVYPYTYLNFSNKFWSYFGWGDPVNMVSKLMLKIQKFCSKMCFLGVILHEKHDSGVIFTPNASEIVKMSVF
jgi:hypothetical protein